MDFQAREVSQERQEILEYAVRKRVQKVGQPKREKKSNMLFIERLGFQEFEIQKRKSFVANLLRKESPLNLILEGKEGLRFFKRNSTKFILESSLIKLLHGPPLEGTY